ncbi:MAG: Gfo/Idh/MocA family oxidoreductase [Sulfuricurvum sp.]|nr:Gfo/Idh/MocA family oxidoreductase [Sulfuricurvum sp.]
MKVLLIGYGSIGKRHYEVLSQIDAVAQIDIVTAQNLPQFTTFDTLERVDQLESYDYFVIASETFKHFEQLSYLENRVKNKTVFCEKPLFETNRALDIYNNRVFVGYVLRFHPLLQKLKQALQNEQILSASINCGHYLPHWREGINYQDSYSASRAKGGGVLLDLSHEIDYAQWLFGRITTLHSFQEKISDLEIDSDDFVTLIAKTDHNIRLTLTIDYISKITHRRMFINAIDSTYELDFINNSLLIQNKNGEQRVHTLKSLERNSMFTEMHLCILSTQESAATYQEAQAIMQTISRIQEQNNG